jgi:uncharacterized membrane protein
MNTFLKLYLTAAIVFTVIDLVWLGFVAKKMYLHYIGDLLKPKANVLAAIAFYVLFLVGLVLFVIEPAYDKNSLMHATVYGALFGFFTYITYDLTNLATLKKWSPVLSLIDIAWGTILAATVSVITVSLTR